jgi:O-antigen/teichoic acid export membrane protein
MQEILQGALKIYLSSNFLNMTVKSLKINGFMYTMKVVVTLLFPLISFPYMSRILGPQGVGWINFATSFSGYFVLFAGIGIPFHGIREISRVRDDEIELAAKTKEIFLMHMLASFISFLVYLFVINMQKDLMHQHLIFVVMSFSIPLTALSMDWFYQGMEKYVYITIRTILFSIVSLVALFIFVRRPEHYVVCAAISIFASLGSSVLNFWNARKFIFSPKTRPLKFRSHLKSMGKSYAILLVSSLYLNIDVVFLGVLSQPENVGYYTAASRFLTAVWSLISSFGATLVPRLSYFNEKGQEKEFQAVINKSIEITMLLCLPAMVGSMVLSNEIILIFAGEKFLPAVSCLNITLPGLMFAALANIFAWQILFPKNKDGGVIFSLGIAAAISLASNFVLISNYHHIGAAVSKLLAETVVFIALYFQAKKICEIKLFDWLVLRVYIFSSLLMMMAIFLVKILIINLYLKLVVSISLGVFLYFYVLMIFKVKIVEDIFDDVREKVSQYRKFIP